MTPELSFPLIALGLKVEPLTEEPRLGCVVAAMTSGWEYAIGLLLSGPDPQGRVTIALRDSHILAPFTDCFVITNPAAISVDITSRLREHISSPAEDEGWIDFDSQGDPRQATILRALGRQGILYIVKDDGLGHVQASTEWPEDDDGEG